MTECERLILNGTFTSDFFKPETRCDFFVSEKMKKIWAIGIDLLLQIDRVCQKHSLRYFLGYGSLLGAVRHGGFIPWDDDIDIVMMRDDYEKLMALGHEFGEPYFLQIPCKDHGYYYSYAKLRNSRTTGISEVFKYQGYNHGMFLDIFPLDVAPETEDVARYNRIRDLNIDLSNYMRKSHPNLSEENKARVKSWSGRRPEDVFDESRSLMMKYHGSQTDFVSAACLSLYSYPRNLFHLEDFSSSVVGWIEGFEFPIPVGYDRILTSLYGDYMKPPPIEKRGTWHAGSVFDPDRFYTEYLKEKTK